MKFEKVKAVLMFLLAAAVIAMVAMGIEWLSGGWVPAGASLVLFILSPLIADIVLGLVGKPNEVVAFLIFPTVIYGTPALIIYWIVTGVRLLMQL